MHKPNNIFPSLELLEDLNFFDVQGEDLKSSILVGGRFPLKSTSTGLHQTPREIDEYYKKIYFKHA